MTSPDAIPQNDGPAYDPLPQQDAIFRPAVRFGHEPMPRTPLGWDPKKKDFLNHYPFISLPTLETERISFGAPDLEPNRLIWGDCLHVMRQIPSASVDLVYIDPPFFSNRVYNVIWGDQNEERSFSDIWKGGLDGYLIWLNARLYEMRRILKPTGSIYVHCDWHASHYIKAEMDKIYGYDNFRNEVVWHYKSGALTSATKIYPRKHDILLLYSKESQYRFNTPRENEISDQMQRRWGKYFESDGKTVLYGSIRHEASEEARSRRRIHAAFGREPRDSDVAFVVEPSLVRSVWTDIPEVRNNPRYSETIGYPTQKPEALLERIIKASSNEGDVVADFFIGGGTTAAVAQRLGRRFIACDQSRVAVAVTAERLKQAAQARLNEEQYPDFRIEQWGIYEAARLANASPDEFRKFVLECYDARIPSADEGIHGYKGARARIPVWVGQPALAATVTTEDVQGFAQAIAALPRYAGDEALRDGIMLAWGFTPGALNAAEELRGRGAAEIAFVRLEQVRIDSPAFRRHIASQSTDRGDYSNFLTFVQPPDVSFACRQLRPLRYAFDAADTQAYNPDAQIISVQWDFAFDGAFRAERRQWADRAKLTAEHTFPRAGTYNVACKAQDDKGGEGMKVIELEVS